MENKVKMDTSILADQMWFSLNLGERRRFHKVTERMMEANIQIDKEALDKYVRNTLDIKMGELKKDLLVFESLGQ